MAVAVVIFARSHACIERNKRGNERASSRLTTPGASVTEFFSASVEAAAHARAITAAAI